MIERACPVCGASDSAVFAAANFDFDRLDDFAFASRKRPEYMHYQLNECRGCDVLFASPLPQGEQLQAAYESAAFDSAPEAAWAAQRYAAILDRHVLPRLGERDGAVDIGTGDGVFLKELLARGFQGVSGVEPSRAPIDAADREIKPLIRQGMFDAAHFQEGSLSLVTCFQTIEHVDEPARLCADVHRLLRNGGAAMLVFHNRRALSAKLLGLRSPIFDIEHLQLFSRKSMQRLLEGSGFTSIKVFSVTNTYPVTYWARLFPFPERLKTPLLRWTERTSFARIPLALPAGNMAAVAFKSVATIP